YITNGIPFETFPYDELAIFPYEASGEVIIKTTSGKPVAAVKKYGKGRIIAFSYYPRDILPQHCNFSGWDPYYEAIFSNWNGSKHKLHFNYLEYFYSLINRSIIWAAKKEPSITIKDIILNKDSFRINLNTIHSRTNSYRVSIKNEYDDIIMESTSTRPVFNLPECLKYGGNFRFECFVLDNDKVCDWFTMYKAFPRASTISFNNDFPECLKNGDSLIFAISFTSVCPQNSLIKVEIIDDFDRIIFRNNYSVSIEKGDFIFEYPIENIPSINITVLAYIVIDNIVVSKVFSPKIVVTPTDRDFHDFEVFICPQNRGQGDLIEVENRQLHLAGSTGFYYGDNKLSTYCAVDHLGIPWHERKDYVARKEAYITTKDKINLHRINCFNNPEFWNKCSKNIVNKVLHDVKYGPISYFANDEGSLTCYTDELEVCFCPHCMKKMSEWLKGEYTSINELNISWGTTFYSWATIEPLTYEEAKKAGNFASWGDHRRFMEISFAQAYTTLRDIVREVDPVARIRMSGTQSSTPYSGYDFYLLHQSIGYFEAYSGGNQFELHRSFKNEGTIIGRCSGYGVSGITAINNTWEALYHQLSFISIFWEYSILNFDFTLCKSGSDYATIFNEIKRGGIGKLLLYGAERDSLGVAVYYSMNSIHGSYMREKLDKYDENRQGWINVLEDLGYQYNFVSSHQVEKGELNGSKYRLLILPYSISLSPKEVKEISRFVSSGGFIIGDFQTGIMDEHCSVYDKGSLDDIFGIERFSNEAITFYLNNDFIKASDFQYFDVPTLEGCNDIHFEEPYVRVKNGTAAYLQDFSHLTPALVVNKYGKGTSIYLNFALDKYTTQRKQSNESSLRNIIKELLIYINIRKPATLLASDNSPIESGYETIYYSDNSANYIGVLRELGGNIKIGHDGLPITSSTNMGTVNGVAADNDKIKIQLDDKAYVYDIRAKEFLGFTNVINTSIINGETQLFSILPYKIDDILLEMPDSVLAGEKMNIDIVVLSDMPLKIYNNVLAISFTDPNGEYSWIYSENIITNNKSAKKSVSIPFNEKTGDWKVSVTDVATGITSEKVFRVI
ncbi:MAG TPA: beta-galactosidase trimerization domain-containing protein, partial [Clostridia bacterium]|nr:beta-galactosidase trimerization domain-containing protein [Clostridia bacterium]